MREYLSRLLDVEMQRFGIFTTVMVASAGGSVGLLLSSKESMYLVFSMLGFMIAIVSALFTFRTYIRINRVLEELKNA